MIEVYDVRIAACLLVDDGVKIDEWIVFVRVLVLFGGVQQRIGHVGC